LSGEAGSRSHLVGYLLSGHPLSSHPWPVTQAPSGRSPAISPTFSTTSAMDPVPERSRVVRVLTPISMKWVWQSMMPGMTVFPVTSMTSAPSGTSTSLAGPASTM